MTSPCTLGSIAEPRGGMTVFSRDFPWSVLGANMPWFPDFAIGVELVRRETEAAGKADPVMQYFNALDKGDAGELERVWPGSVVIHDPRAGEIRGHRQLRQFVKQNKAVFAKRHARTEKISSTCVGGRAVVELLAHLDGDADGGETVWPLAVVVESPDDRSVTFRTYCSQWPIDGRRHLRPAILASRGTDPADVVGRYRAALSAGDVDGVLGTFETDGYLREPIGPDANHQGTEALRSYFERCFDGGGVELEPCVVTDDGVRCALEYNCVRWGNQALTPQAGIGIYERGPDGLLAAARMYDDVEAPFAS
jgi:ketosteroid isomerase-like protein